MIRSIPLKVVAAGGALALVGGAAVAAAMTMPEEANDGLTKASERSGLELPASHRADAAEVEDTEELEVEEIEVEDIELEDDVSELEEDEGEGPVDNHGAVVSDFAQNTELTGRERGQAIAEVARSDAGKPNHDDADAEDAEELEDDSDTDAQGGRAHGAERAAAGGGNGNGRGNGGRK